jgi:hypothetical protein
VANIQVKSGGYTVHAMKAEEFSFWWGAGYYPAGYFDVSIEPNAEGLDMIPLIEEKRQVTTVAPSGDLRQPMLILTLRNNNKFDVPFFANHILVNA